MAQADEFNYLLAKTAWMSANKYFQLLQKLVENNDAIEKGNLDTMMSEGSYKEYAAVHSAPPPGQYDARSLVPFIFSLYNSIEQLLLAYYYVGFPDQKLTFVPTYERLETKFFEFDLAKNQTITDYISKYSRDEELPALLKGLLDASGYGVDHFKTTRRALENNNLFNVLDKYQAYYYPVLEGKEFFAEVYEDVSTVMEIINLLIKNVDDDGSIGDVILTLKVS